MFTRSGCVSLFVMKLKLAIADSWEREFSGILGHGAKVHNKHLLDIINTVLPPVPWLKGGMGTPHTPSSHLFTTHVFFLVIMHYLADTFSKSDLQSSVLLNVWVVAGY